MSDTSSSLKRSCRSGGTGRSVQTGTTFTRLVKMDDSCKRRETKIDDRTLTWTTRRASGDGGGGVEDGHKDEKMEMWKKACKSATTCNRVFALIRLVSFKRTLGLEGVESGRKHHLPKRTQP